MLASLSAIAQVSRAEHEESGAARLTCTRDDALIDVQSVGGPDGLIVILSRRLSRRRQRVADVALTGELVDALHELGAQTIG
jgi:hypothetical protein